jgi:DNA-binding response OmpR family regulator
MHTILVVEDNDRMRTALAKALKGPRRVVRAVATAAEALQETAGGMIDLVVLDLGLPDLDGATVLRTIRGYSTVPVIVATARSEEPSVIGLLEAGADDYVVKPFTHAHLAARVRALLRRAAMPVGPIGNTLHVGELHIDLAGRSAWFGDRSLDLTRREFDLLVCLTEQAGRVVRRRVLLERVWSGSEPGNDQTLNVHVAWLRRKLGETGTRPRYLHTVRGIGLKLVAPEDES